MYDILPLQYLPKTFTCSSNVTLPNIRKGLVKVTFPLPLEYLNSSLFKTLNVYFRAAGLFELYSLFKRCRLSM